MDMVRHSSDLNGSTTHIADDTSNICENPFKVFFSQIDARALDMEH